MQSNAVKMQSKCSQMQSKCSQMQPNVINLKSRLCGLLSLILSTFLLCLSCTILISLEQFVRHFLVLWTPTYKIFLQVTVVVLLLFESQILLVEMPFMNNIISTWIWVAVVALKPKLMF